MTETESGKKLTAVERTKRWRLENPERHRQYNREYMRRYRARKRAEERGES